LTTLLLTAVIALPMLYISTRNVKQARAQMMSDLEASAARDVAAAKGEVGALVQNYKRGVAAATAIISAQRLREQAALQQVLAVIRSEYPEFAGMYVADAAARTIAFDPPYNQSGQSSIGLSYSDRQYYRDLLATKTTVYSGVYQARSAISGLAVVIVEPLLDERGELTGFVLGGFDVKSLQRIAGRYHREGQTLIMTDAAGRLIADSSLAPGAYTEVLSLANHPDFALTAGRADGTLYYTHRDTEAAPTALTTLNDTFLLSFATMPVSSWKVWSRQSLRPLKAQLDQFYLHHLAVLLLMLLLALGLGRLAARLLTRPITELQRSAERLTAGNLSERSPPRRLTAVEFESLFRSFDHMAERLEASWNRQQELLRQVSLAKGEGETTFDAMADAVVILDAEDRLLRANRSYFQMKGLALGTGIGRPFIAVAHPEGGWESCEVCHLRRAAQPAVVQLPPEKNPTRRHVEVRIDPIYNEQGGRVGVVQVVRDLTQIRRAEAEKAGALLRNLVEAAYDAVCATDLRGQFLRGRFPSGGVARSLRQFDHQRAGRHAARRQTRHRHGAGARAGAGSFLPGQGAGDFADTGHDMSQEVRQRIFEPFFTTKGSKGYGMGLAVSYGIIERHGGEIEVASAPGRGTTFTLRLPLAQIAAEPKVLETAPAAPQASILVVDDEAPIRALLADLLRARGHAVLTAEDGLAGLQAMEESRFDLMITDLSMPGADGWRLAREARRRWPGTKLVVITGYGGFAGGDASLVDALISKPFDLAQFDAAINELLLTAVRAAGR
jgi:PAS domain S-box-containing protein